jgi:transcriptional regulator with XRE-family HTH domain
MDSLFAKRTIRSMAELSESLRERARELGLSHAEAARRAGLSERRYGNYVSGVREPDLRTLARIAEVLQTTPNDLLGFRTDKTEPDRSILIDRMNQAAHRLTAFELELLTVQMEAVAKRSR